MKVEVVLTESDISHEFVEAVEARDLPEKFFHWFPRSADESTKLSQDSELFGTLWGSWKDVCADAPLLVKHFNGVVPVISFGSGDGGRDRLLMGALTDAGLSVRYFPVDASQTMLETACTAADDEDIETTGIKADISSPVHLVYAADAAEPPRLFLFCGNTLGAFDPLAEIRYVAQCMKENDRLILDGEIYDDKLTIARRDNPAVRRLFHALLASVGIEPNDGEIRFDKKSDSRAEGLYLVTRYFRAARDLSATVAGEEISLERGERIGMNFQYTFTPAAFRWLVSEHGGLTIEREYTSSDARFMTFVCRK